MKFYLASSFKFIKQVKKVATVLEMDGHEITEKWWCRPYQVEGLGEIETSELKEIYENLSHYDFYKKPETRTSYWKDFQGIIDADAFIFVASFEEERKYNGASVEYGIALGLDKPCGVFGFLEKSVLFWPLMNLPSLQSIREWANKLEEQKK